MKLNLWDFKKILEVAVFGALDPCAAGVELRSHFFLQPNNNLKRIKFKNICQLAA